MKRFRRHDLPSSSYISIEYIVDHELAFTSIINRKISFSDDLADAVHSLIDSEGISIDDVVSFNINWSSLYLNKFYDGKSFKIVGED